MNTLLSLLLLIANNSLNHDVNYDITMAILNNYNQLNQLTLSSLAKESQTSVTSVKKFCEMLGCSSFTDFKYMLATTNQVRKKQITFRIQKTNEEKMIQLIKQNAPADFDEQKYKEDVYALADLLYKSKKLVILGACFPNALSLSFQEDMITMGKVAYSYPLVENSMHIHESSDTLILILTITGRIYEYFQNSLNELGNQFHDIVVIGGINENVPNPSISLKIDLPVIEDDEIGNVFILETLRYLKYIYFEKYIKKF